MCVTQLNCIEIKGNYGAPVRSYLHLAISNLLFQVLLTLTKARQSLAGRDNNILWASTHLKYQHSKSGGSNLARTVLDSICSLWVRLQINSPEPNLSSAESYGCWEVNLKTKRGTSNWPYLSISPKQCLLKAEPCVCLLNEQIGLILLKSTTIKGSFCLQGQNQLAY